MKNSLDRSEKSIIFVCILAIAICLYFLKNLELFFIPFSSENSSLSVGKIEKINADVRQKLKKEYSWKKSVTAASLSEGDSLFTGPKSSCEIVLDDGKIFKLSENSLVRISKKNKQLAINLEFGKILTSGLTTPLQVIDCGHKYEIDPNQAEFEISKMDMCGTLNFEIKKGEIKIDRNKVSRSNPNKIKKPNTFHSSDILPALIAEKKVEVVVPVAVPDVPPPIVLTEPNFKQLKYSEVINSNTKIRLQWDPVTNAKSYIIEIADSSEFTGAKIISTEQNALNFKPGKSGKVHFRVKATAADGTFGPYSQVAQAQFAYPSIELQQQKIVSEYKARNSVDEGRKKEFPVSWSPIANTEKYVIDVDQANANFTTPLASTTSRTPSSIVEVPKTGQYIYRVSAYSKDGRKISSSLNPGEINYQKVFNITAPIIDASLKSISYYFQKDFGQFVWLRWSKPTEEASKLKYRIQISNSADFKAISYNLMTNENKFLMNKNLDKGNYFWRVRTENSEQYSDWSDVGFIRIQTKATQ